MKNILTIFSGSAGHVKGLQRFIQSNKIQHKFIFASNVKTTSVADKNKIQLKTAPAFLNHEFSQPLPLLEKLKLKIDDVFYRNRKKELQALLSNLKPDILLLDNFNFTDALIARELHIDPKMKIVLYQTRLSTALNKKTSGYGGAGNKNEFAYLPSRKILRQQKVGRIIRRLTLPGFSDELKLNKYFKKLNLTNVELDRKRKGPASLTYLPELILSNKALSTYCSHNQYYMGMGLETKPNDKSDNRNKNILVSTGSRPFTFDMTDQYVTVIRDMVHAFRDMVFYVPENFTAKLSGLKNVQYYKWNTYARALSKADIHITHGGINSIKDTLSRGLPMLICPLDWRSDQIHNALLFRESGMTEIWNLKNDASVVVASKLNNVIKSNFRETIKAFAAKDERENPPEKIRERSMTSFRMKDGV